MTLFNPSSARTNNAATGFAARVMSGASLLLRPGAGFYGAVAANGIEIDPSPDLLRVSVARASAAWDSQSALQNGERVGRLVEYPANRVRAGAAGIVREAGAVTNRVPNPRGEGADGSTPPTGWIASASGLTLTYEQGVLNGWPGVFVTATGTGNGTTFQISPAAATVVAASTGQTWTGWAGVALVAGSLSDVRAAMVERDSGGAQLAATEADIVPLDSNLRSLVATRTFNNASTAFASPAIRRNSLSGAQSFTLFIAAPQLTQTSAPAHPILPPPLVPAASTRAAETFTFDGFEGVRASREYYVGEDGSLSVFGVNATAFGTRGVPVFMETTNRTRNPRGLGGTPGVIGSGGAYPTNWGEVLTDGTREFVGRGEDDFGSYTEWQWTTTGAGTWRLLFESATQIVAANNEWTAYQARVRIVGGSALNLSGFLLRMAGRTAAGTLVQSLDGSLFTPSSTIPTERELIRQLSGATIERVSTEFDVVATGAANVRFRIYDIQLERDRRFCSPVALPAPRVIAEATRAASAPRVFVRPQLFQRTGVTILGEVILRDFFGTSSDRQVFGQINNGGTVTRHGAYLNTGSGWRLSCIAEATGLFTDDPGITAVAARPRQRIAVRFSDANVGWAVSDGLNTYSKFDLVPSASLQLESCDRITLGSEGGGNRQINGFITDFRVIPGLLTDAQLSEYVAF